MMIEILLKVTLNIVTLTLINIGKLACIIRFPLV